jgi:hypothetical protein
MNVYHVRLQEDDGWYVLTKDEDPTLVTQSRTLDEAVVMMRDLLACHDLPKAELRLIIPPELVVDDMRQSGRITDWDGDEAPVVPPANPKKHRAAS